MKKISREELNEMLVKHELWLKNKGGEQLNLENVDLRDFNLRNANLECANLRNANLEYANLRNANLEYAKLRNAGINHLTIGYHLACPEEGSFIGYKKANECLVKLLILEDSKRSICGVAPPCG